MPVTTIRSTTTRATTTARPTTTRPLPTTHPDRPTTPRPSTSSSTAPVRPSTDDLIDPDDPGVLFFSNNDDCRGIENSQRHPDWVEGQPNASRNEDGTPTYGYAYNTGDSTSGEISWGFVERNIALSGDCVLSMGVRDAYENKRAIRIFRRYDRHGNNLPDDAYYSVWFYFPQEVSFDSRATVDGSTAYGFWNVFQIKNKVGGQSLSSLSVNAGKVTGEDSMSFHIWRKAECGAVEECSASAGIDQSDPIPIPTGRWVHLEMYLKASNGSDGRVTLWQDGQQIIDFTGVTERQGSIRRNWSVNNYGRLHRPASHELFVDDVLISTDPIHRRLFD